MMDHFVERWGVGVGIEEEGRMIYNDVIYTLKGCLDDQSFAKNVKGLFD